MQID
jgi:hypothetical protein